MKVNWTNAAICTMSLAIYSMLVPPVEGQVPWLGIGMAIMLGFIVPPLQFERKD